MENTSDYLTPKEVSKITGWSIKTLAIYRSGKEKKGIPYYKRGNRIFYKRQDVFDFIEGGRVEVHNAE